MDGEAVKEIAEVVVAVVEAELVCAEVAREVVRIDPVGLAVPALGEAPEALDAVAVAGTAPEGDLRVDRQVFPVALEVDGAAELVGEIDRALAGVGPDFGPERLLGAVGHDHAVDLAAPLQQAENTHFPGGPRSGFRRLRSRRRAAAVPVPFAPRGVAARTGSGATPSDS